MTPSVAVIIVTYNGETVIGKCLEVLTKSTDLLDSIIVVDNNSTDNTLQILEDFKDQIQLIKSKSNLGFGQANNKGIVKALDQGADYILLLNQDVYFDRKNLQQFLEQAHSSTLQNIGIFSPIHLDGSGEQLDYNFKTFLFKNNPSEIVDAYMLNSKDSHESYETDFVNAAIWLLPKTTLKVIGGFDPIFFHYGEDRNYVNRLHYHNLSIHVIPDTYARHDRRQTDGDYKKENLARFLYLVEATNLNTKFNTLILLLRLFYRNYLTKKRGLLGVIAKSIKEYVSVLSKGSEIRKSKSSYLESVDYLFIQDRTIS